MTVDFDTFDKKLADTKEWLARELSNIRTGQASAALLDAVRVDVYGSPTPLNQVANIGMEDPRTLRITPWDTSNVQAIERAVTSADLGVSVSSDEKGVRVHFPDLTTETREKFVRMAKQKLEEARVTVRGLRNEENDKIKNIDLSEDEIHAAREKLDDRVAAVNSSFEKMFSKKESEILGS